MPESLPAGWTKVDSLTFVKAFSICLVVLNHSMQSATTGLHGGLNGLMLVSGIVMASLGFRGETRYALRAFVRLALRLAIPSFLLALLWALAYQQFHWPELLFYSNWISKARLVSFPLWYPQVLVQLMAFCYALFWAFDLAPKLQKWPVRITGLLLAFSVIVALGSYAMWDTKHLHDKLPHLLMWNFFIGWFYWAMAVKNEKTLTSRLMLTLALLACNLLVFIIADAAYGESRFVWFSLIGLTLIWLDSIPLPVVLARIVVLISSATLYIFFLHYPAIGRVQRIIGYFGLEQLADSRPLLFAAGVFLPVFLSTAVTAAIHVRRKTRVSQPEMRYR